MDGPSRLLETGLIERRLEEPSSRESSQDGCREEETASSADISSSESRTELQPGPVSMMEVQSRRGVSSTGPTARSTAASN